MTYNYSNRHSDDHVHLNMRRLSQTQIKSVKIWLTRNWHADRWNQALLWSFGLLYTP